MLRNRLPDDAALYQLPVRGINLRSSLAEILPGEAEKMQNFYVDGGMRKRLGSTWVTASTSSLGAFTGTGGIKVYPQTASNFRVITYATTASVISDAGAETVLTNALTSHTNARFYYWSITDNLYAATGAQDLFYISSTPAYATISGTNVPTTPVDVCPYLDRLFAIQGSVVVSSNPRVDSVWATTGSTWAAYRPIGGAGPPMALHLHSLTGQQGDPVAQLLIFQGSAVTALTGTNFGDNVTAGSPPTGWDAALTLLSPRLGTRSPYSIVTVPGYGTFWFTQDFNVAWLPFNAATPKLIADNLFSNRSDIYGLNHVTTSALDQVWMVYHDRKLKLGIPINGKTFATHQFWLDLRALETVTEISGSIPPPAWSGPHTGQSLKRVWVESDAGDQGRMYGLEGDLAVAAGLYVYEISPVNWWYDAIGATQSAVSSDYRGHYHTAGAPSWEKYWPDVRLDVAGEIENASVCLVDLHGDVDICNLRIRQNDGTAFSLTRYGTSLTYGSGIMYGQNSVAQIGHVDVNAQSTSAVLGDAIQMRVTHSTGNRFIINRALPQIQVRRQQQVG